MIQSRPSAYRALAFVLLSLSSTSNAVAQSAGAGAASRGSTSQIPESLDSAANAAFVSSRAPGMAVVVLRAGDTLLSRGYGFADVSRSTPATVHSVFQIGSLTKQFTAAAVLQLISSGQLRLQDSVARVLPDWRGSKAVTVHSLLTHTSGIPNFTELPAFRANASRFRSPLDVQRTFESEPLQFTPAEQWAYSNSGYILLGRIIERISGRRYADYIRDHFAMPLGLLATRVCNANQPADVIGYDIENGAVTPTAPVDPTIPFAAGAICSSVLDIARWMAALRSGKVVPAAAFTTMTTPVALKSGRRAPYGYGMELSEIDDHARVGHGGAISGFDSYAAYYPDDQLTVVVLMNRAGANAEAVEKQLARIALGIREAAITELPLTAADALRYIGQYRAGPGRVTISHKGARLHVEGPVDADLMRVASDTFVLAEEHDVRLVFSVEGSRATSIAWTSRGRTMTLPRIE